MHEHLGFVSNVPEGYAVRTTTTRTVLRALALRLKNEATERDSSYRVLLNR